MLFYILAVSFVYGCLGMIFDIIMSAPKREILVIPLFFDSYADD